MDEHRPRILIVEDDEATAGKYRRVIEKLGDSRTAECAEQVFRETIDFDPQLILLDIVLEGEKLSPPKEEGIRILERIEAFKTPFKRISVVVITALIDPEIENICRELGAVDFFHKPVPLKMLRQAVQKALEEQYNWINKQISVFISSPMKELEAERQIVKQAIRELGPQYNPELAEDWAARPEPPSKVWQQAAKDCDIFVLLLGQEYGIPSPVTGISPTEDEYDQARNAGKPILVFKKELPGSQCDPRLIAFMARLSDPKTGHVFRSFSSIHQLRAEVQRAIRKIELHKKSDAKHERSSSILENYVDFDLHITPNGHAIASSIEGQASAKISTELPKNIPLSLKLIEKRAVDADLLKELGQVLYDWIFPGPIHTHFQQTEAVARRDDAKMRLRLRIEAEEIAKLPLEFLYRKMGGYYIATNPNTVLSRYLNLPLPPKQVRQEKGPLHLLTIIADPNDQTRLPPDEWETIVKEALAKPQEQGQMTLQIVKRATRKEIRNALLKQKPDIIQFVGHGIYENGKGYLALVEEETGKTWLVNDEQFVSLYQGHSDHLGLISLATCESAKSDDPQNFLGVAPKLVQHGVPAVLAMQYPVFIKTAKIFLEDFYTAIAAHKPVDWATQSARNAVSQELGLDNREFATPVLYMRAQDGNVF